MSKIEELIEQLCPKGVEFIEMQEVFEIRNGYTPSKANREFWENGTIPWFRMEDIRENGRVLSDSIQHITPESVKGSGLFTATSIIVSTSATIGEHALITVDFLANQRFTCLTRKNGYAERLDMFFFQYYMFVVGEWCKNNINISGFAGVDMSKFKKLQIPIPPLPIQQEIVAILDKFTQLEAELEAELDARKRQYEYYRNQLLNFEGKEEEWKTLGEVGEFKYGFTDKAKELGNVRFVRITDINENGKLRANDCKYLDLTDENKEYLISKGDLLMARTGATFGKTMLFNENYQAVYASFLIRIRFTKKNILPAFYWHFSQSEKYWVQANRLVGGGAQPQFNANVLKTIQIPIPPLAEQERIVSILDKFDALVNDISVGLPAEIQARRKQYEYYRGKLLDFKNINNG